MKKTILFFLFFIFLICICKRVYATNNESTVNQLIKQVIPPSPVAAAFARYGEYPVSLSTGVPQIDIPIYTIDMRGFKLPISISYHASGIKVTDVATPVGLGWVLNAGGVISRSTCGKDDVSQLHSMDVTSSAQVSQYMSNKSKPIHFWDDLLSSTAFCHDSQSDRYCYNFNGKAGVFRYDIETGEIKTIPYSPISIKATTSGYKIIDTDGIEYYFEQEEDSNISSPGCSTLFPTSWYMSKIKNPNSNDSIRFVYKTGTNYSTYYPSQYVDVGVEIHYQNIIAPDVPSTLASRINTMSYSWTRICNLPVLLDSIVWDKNIINLTYASDRSDIYKDRLTKLSISYNGNKVKEAVFGNGSYWGDNSSNYRMKLDNLIIQGTDNPEAKERYSFAYDPTSLPDYYNMNKVDAFRCSEDYWGYFNGVQSKYIVPSRYCASDSYSTDRTPKEAEMKDCSLIQITYPTGGKTIFDYEINKVLRAYDYNVSTEAAVGGLRIKTITNQDKDGTILGVKNYEYSGIATNMIRYAMYSSTMNYIYYYFWNGDNLRNDSEHKISVAYPVTPLTDWSGSPVFYSTVTEYNGTSSSNSGKIVYKYMQDLDNLGGCESNVDDQLKFYSELNNCDQGIISPLLLSQSTYKNSGGNYILEQTITNDYTEEKAESFIAGVSLNRRDVVVFTSDGANGFDTSLSGDSYLPYDSESDYYNSIVYYDILAFRGISVLTSTSTTDYDDSGNSYTITKDYSYDPQLRIMSPIKTIQTDSKGEAYTIINMHPFDLTDDIYLNMAKSNYVEPVIKSMEYLGSTLLKTTFYEYRNENWKYLIDNVQLANGNNNLEKRILYNKYDLNGNPLEVVQDVYKKIVYLWSYCNQYPIAKIEGMTYSEVESILGTSYIKNLADEVVPSDTQIQTICSLLSKKEGGGLSNSMITTYAYKPLVGMASMCNPRGEITTYDYDSMGRLTSVKDCNGKVLENYSYNYHNL